ncbi:MAG: InlB B-repeat-containing protein, partial [Kiritimatiellae bacterium]|nr:InlB B-repeat-containing protein [Kiritimatiellia bacterium]
NFATITDVGSIANGFDYTFTEGTLAENYAVTCVTGTLTVAAADIGGWTDETKWSVTLAGDGAIYDGTEKTCAVTTLAYDGFAIPTFTVTGDTATDAGDYTLTITGTGNFVGAHTVPWSIVKRTVTLTSGSAGKVYDGTELTKHEVTVGGDGFAEGEGASYTYTGTQTDIGESENTFTYTLNDGTKAGNYDIVTANGKLTVETFPYAVTFNANGGSGAMEDLAFTYGQDAALTVNAFTRTGYTYQGWATSAEGEVVYTDGQTVGNLTMTPNGTVNLYAVWHPNAYTIRFLPNGAEGEMADQAMAYDTAVDLAANAFVKEGFWFVGWCAEGEEAVSYTNRQQVVNLATNDGAVVTLIAKWADAWYVDAANGDDANEGISAEQPFKTIQRAIDRAEEGQLIVVADGVYAPIASGDKAITIRSVNGAFATVIDGEGTAICANLGRAEATAAMTNTVLYGFTVRNGSSPLDAGGVLGGTVYNCLIVSNRAERCGGGAAWATLANCVIADNRALTGNGGGLYNSSANGCTVVGNVASVEGGGSFADISDVANNNCIVFGNTATRNAAIAGTVTKRGCFTGDPRFVDAANGDFRLKGDSPCIDMGNNRYVTGETDIRGNARIQNDIVDIGAYEFTLPAELGNVQVEGEDAAVPVEWLGAYGYVDEDSTAETLQPVMTQVGDNGIPLWESWVAGFDPWDSDSRLLAYIRAVGDEIEISWAPDLSNAEPKRYYTVIGKTNLTDSAWVTPVNEAHRFFKVRVSMSEPGLAKEVTATEGTSPVNVSLAWQAAKWALGYNIYRVAGDDFNRATLIASVTETEYVDATAVPGTLYTYWIVSTANGGEWVRSEPVSGYRKIGVPRHVSASDGSSTEWISVTWDAVEGAVSYRVLRATTGSLEEAVEVGTSTGTSWTDNDVESGVIYTYWVVAVGAGISSEVSSSDEGYLRLGVPGNVTATNGGFVDRVDVAWDPVTAASHYRVFRSTSASGSKTAVSEWQTGLTYSDTTAEAGVTYYYFVAAALDDMGLNASGYSAGVVGSLRLGAPTVYATDGTSASGVTVSWVEVPGAESYTVYRGTVNVPEAAQVVATTAEALFEDTTAEPGTLYYYWVVAANTVSESEWSVYETGFRSMAAPTGVTATTGSGADAVTISWTPVEGALFYRVYRGTRSGTVYAVEIDTTTETTYVDEGGAANRTYYYSVKAVGASCESDFSAFVPGSR